jgi:argininosuccinate lyase
MLRFSSSLDDDLRLFDADVEASIAHATMLGETGILPREEAAALVRGLEELRADFHAGRWRPDPAQEDIHVAVEERLTEMLGEVGKKLHTARSRNDQVATDVRLWLKRALGELDAALGDLVATFLDRIESDGRTLLPGYTHLQRGQPILLGHHLLAHAWPLVRDRERLAEARGRLDRSPLGACAMAGTPHPIDRRSTARRLGFSGPVENAMDAVAARDHLLEVVAACAIAMTHLSRMAEELVLWSSAEFGFVRLDEAYATGSSIMPQKRNPDAAELVRGKAARVYGDLQTLLALVKALPLAYNRDLQEDKRIVFHADDVLAGALEALAAMLAGVELDPPPPGPETTALDLAEALVGRGVPFREAHDVVGRLVMTLEGEGRSLGEVTMADFSAVDDRFQEEDVELVDPEASLRRRISSGSGSPQSVRDQVAAIRDRL